MPPGKGPRWILIGAGSAAIGWLKETIVYWTGESNAEDYHTNMDSEIFEDWFRGRLLGESVRNNKNVLGSGVIVVDRATYHTRCTPESSAATSSMSKEALVQWIVNHRCAHQNGTLYTLDYLKTHRHELPSGRVVNGLSKMELLEIATENAPKKDLLVWKWTREFNAAEGTDVRVLVLPVAHPELNPIEMQWGDIKRYVRQRNSDCNMQSIRLLAQERQAQQTKESWEKVHDHMLKFASTQWESDEIVADEREGEVEEHLQHGNGGGDDMTDEGDGSDSGG